MRDFNWARFDAAFVLGAFVLTATLATANALRAESKERTRVVVQAENSAEAKFDNKRAPKPRTASASKPPRAAAAITPDKEAAALAFVKQYHPELHGLLQSLRDHQPEEFEKAIRDLSRTAERLRPYRENDVARYELEVRMWQAQSRVELLTAQVLMGDSPELRKDLRTAVEHKLALQREVYQAERQRLTDRLNRLDQQIERLDNQGDAMVERQVELLLRPLKSDSKPRRTSPTKNLKTN
ncbi:MAG: hypothetical protein KDA62_03110 [Planctomycetales bacterium]|nr:hypothetical protein [Planctomycetales bacterium]